MKRLFLLFLLFLSITTFSQVDYNIYIDKTKKEICNLLKEDEFKYTIEEKLYVEVDSLGHWSLSENYYTYLFYYSNIKALFTFNNKTNKCVKYYLLCENLEDYWNYFEYYNQILQRSNKEDDLTWTEKRHKFYVEINMKALNPKQFQIFAKRILYK